MDSFSSRWSRLFEAANVTTDSALSRFLDIKPSSVGRAKKREMIPGAWVEKICQEYKVNANWLLFGLGDKYLAQKQPGLNESSPGSEPVEFQDCIKKINTLEARIAALEKELISAQADAIRAYRLATESMQPATDHVQKEEETAAPAPLSVKKGVTKEDEDTL